MLGEYECNSLPFDGKHSLNDGRILAYINTANNKESRSKIEALKIGALIDKCLDAIKDEQTKSDIHNKIQEIGLPVFKMIETVTSSFLSNPDYYFEQLPSSEYYIEAKSSTTNEKIRDFGLDSDETINFAMQNSHLDLLILKENYKNIYSGNIVVANDNSGIYIEMVSGTLSSLLHDGKFDYTAYRDEMLGSFKYNTERDEIKELMLMVLSYIPSLDRNNTKLDRNSKFLQGYYEFIIVDKNDGCGLVPVFNDYNQKIAFTNVFRERPLGGTDGSE
jgi:hypothetical protein